MGNIAKLSFRVSSRPTRRMEAVVRRASGCEDFAFKATLTAGMHYYFHGPLERLKGAASC